MCDPERNPQLRKIHSNKETSPPHSDSRTSMKYVSLQTQYCPIEKSSSRRKRNAMSPQSQKEIPQEKSRYLAPQTASRRWESHQRQEYQWPANWKRPVCLPTQSSSRPKQDTGCLGSHLVQSSRDARTYRSCLYSCSSPWRWTQQESISDPDETMS